MRWTEVARMSEKRNAYRILVGNGCARGVHVRIVINDSERARMERCVVGSADSEWRQLMADVKSGNEILNLRVL